MQKTANLLMLVVVGMLLLGSCGGSNDGGGEQNPVLGTSEVPLDGTRINIRSQETNLGNLCADALLWQAMQMAGTFGQPTPDVALLMGGLIRNNNVVPPGIITVDNTLSILPFGNILSIVPGISRDQFKEILENAVACTQPNDVINPICGTGRFAQISGFSFHWNTGGNGMIIASDNSVVVPGTRVVQVVLDNGAVIVTGGSVVPGPSLNIAVTDFMARGGDQYPFRGASFTVLGVSDQGALNNYIRDGLAGLISATAYPVGGEGRIIAITDN